MSHAEKFFKMCTTLPYEEVKDERGEDAVPELLEAAQLRVEGLFDDAIEYTNALTKMFPDFDLLYYFISHVHFYNNQPQQAKAVALNAIPISTRKYRLYSVAGLADFDVNRIPEALVWWCRSIIAQSTVVEYLEYDPFLHIAYTSKVVGAYKQARVFEDIARAIEPNVPLFGEDYMAVLSSIQDTWVETAFQRTVDFVIEQYLA